MMRSWWMVRRMAGLGCAIGALGIPPGLLAQQVPSVTSTSHLTEVVGQTWTNDPAAKLFPPGTEFELNIGGIAFENTFETSLLNSLVPVTNDTVVLYLVSVTETNLPSRQRIYINADEVAVLTSAVNDVNYPNAWIEEAFGPPPGYLAGAELDAWYAERDPARCTLVFDLLSTSDVPDYVAMLTNGVSEVTSTQTWEDLLILYSNDIAAVGILEAAETVGVYVHAPTNVALLDVFSNPDLLDTNAWMHRGVYAHTVDPTLFVDTSTSGMTYAAADALADEDGDSLASGREVFLYGTSAWTNDSDGDLLLDNLELLLHGTDPNAQDSDGDGVLDGEEVAAGLNPTSRDTDLDFASDAYEIEHGCDPLDPTSAPPFLMFINQQKLYTSDTNLSVTFPGLVADVITLGEDVYLSNQTAIAMSDPMSYCVERTVNGPHRIYARAGREGDALETPIFSGLVVLDTVPPLLSIDSPTNLWTTSRRWVNVEGAASDEESSVRILVNGEYVHGIDTNHTFHHYRNHLIEGTNTIEVTVLDRAGNLTTGSVQVIQDTSTDLTAPLHQFFLPLDYEIVGGITNTLGTSTFDNTDQLYLRGWTDDETARIAVTVVGSQGFTNTQDSSVNGTQVWAEVVLYPGTNGITTVASDAAGNRTTNAYVVVRDTNLLFAITSPAPYELIGGPECIVSLTASPAFSNAVITVNGIAVTNTAQGTNWTFETVTPVPIDPGLTEIRATAELNGRSYYADPPPVGYEVKRWSLSRHDEWQDRLWPHMLGYLESDGWLDSRSSWDSATRISSYAENGSSSWCDYLYASGWDCGNSPLNIDHSYSNDQAWEPRHFKSGSEFIRNDYVDSGLNCWDDWKKQWDGRIAFIKHGPVRERQTVIFQFHNLKYGRPEGEPIDPALITYRGQTGFWYNANVSFLVPMETETEYTISREDFTWPQRNYSTSNYFYGGWGVPNSPASIVGNWLSFDWFKNDALKVDLVSDVATNSPKAFELCKTDPASPCGEDIEDAEALTIYYSEVFDEATQQVQDFDVTLRVSPTDFSGATWSKVDGPDSGTLINYSQAEAIYQNPKTGGLYRFDAALDTCTTRTQLWLPVAGPDISAYWQSEIDYFMNTWGPAYRSKLNARTVLLTPWPIRRSAAKVRLATSDMNSLGGHLDWNGSIAGQNTPCGLPNTGNDTFRMTMKGVVVDWHKRNNMMYGLVGKEMGIPETILILGADPRYNPFAIGAEDTPATRASYRAGFHLSDGDTLEDVMIEHGYDMQEPDSGAEKEWPSPEISNDSLNRIGQPQLEELIQ